MTETSKFSDWGSESEPSRRQGFRDLFKSERLRKGLFKLVGRAGKKTQLEREFREVIDAAYPAAERNGFDYRAETHAGRKYDILGDPRNWRMMDARGNERGPNDPVKRALEARKAEPVYKLDPDDMLPADAPNLDRTYKKYGNRTKAEWDKLQEKPQPLLPTYKDGRVSPVDARLGQVSSGRARLVTPAVVPQPSKAVESVQSERAEIYPALRSIRSMGNTTEPAAKPAGGKGLFAERTTSSRISRSPSASSATTVGTSILYPSDVSRSSTPASSVSSMEIGTAHTSDIAIPPRSSSLGRPANGVTPTPATIFSRPLLPDRPRSDGHGR